jgi:Lon protease-like protein
MAISVAIFLLLLAATKLTSAFVSRRVPSTSSGATKRHAYLLNTALEWLAIERSMAQKYGNFSWFLVSDRPAVDDDTETMPLYPLGATYLPSRTNHTLNNVEARNIQMAQDLQEGGRFCVTLAASDSGRFASVGTVMRILELEPHERDGVVKRIIVKCCAEELVDIEGIINPEASGREQRLRNPSEYLKAKVQHRVVEPCPPQEYEEIVSNIIDDYTFVRASYLDGVGTRELPPFALEHLAQALPEWKAEALSSDSGFWDAALVWQTLCYTVREGRQMTLSADRNELMVAAASAKGGPLKLPIHISDLSSADRFRLQELEREAQSDFFGMGLDPCLDFQVIVAMNSVSDRLYFLSKLISRERRRLEKVALEPVAQEEVDELPRNRTGAWFECFE